MRVPAYGNTLNLAWQTMAAIQEGFFAVLQYEAILYIKCMINYTELPMRLHERRLKLKSRLEYLCLNETEGALNY